MGVWSDAMQYPPYFSERFPDTASKATQQTSHRTAAGWERQRTTSSKEYEMNLEHTAFKTVGGI